MKTKNIRIKKGIDNMNDHLIPNRALTEKFTSVEFFKDEFRSCYIDVIYKKATIHLISHNIQIQFKNKKKLLEFSRHLTENLCAKDSNRLPIIYVFSKDIETISFITNY